MNTQLYQVLGAAFGRGTATSTLSSLPAVYAAGGGTLGSTTFTVHGKSGSRTGTFNNGDAVLIHQTRHTSDADNWEVNQIVSGASSSSIVLKNALGRTYHTDNDTWSARVAQMVKIQEYYNLTLNSLTGTGWRAGGKYISYGWGGIHAIAVRNTLTINGTINLNGKNGWASSQDVNGAGGFETWSLWSSVIGGGFRPGANTTDGGNAMRGEGWYSLAHWPEEKRTNDGSSGGGGGNSNNHWGGGGGNGTAGEAAGSGSFAQGGSTSGNTSLTRMWMGGGGGGGNRENESPASGGGGGGIWVIWANNIVFGADGYIQARGGAGVNGTGNADGGAGAGGSILIFCKTATLGANRITATGGVGVGDGSNDGGTGRIAIYHSQTVTGTTSPTYYNATDSQLKTASGKILLANLA